nr:hypothetical protein [uncultured Oscillibacter sp.]
MYNYEYEVDVLLFLRLAKYLHSQAPAALEEILAMYVDFDLPSLCELCESIVWEICANVFFDQDEEYEAAICTFSHPLMDRFCALSGEWSFTSGQSDDAWRRKLGDIAEYYLMGTSYSVGNIECYPRRDSAKLRTWLSSDCYDPAEFGNSLVDMLLHIQRENEQLESLLKEAGARKEAA